MLNGCFLEHFDSVDPVDPFDPLSLSINRLEPGTLHDGLGKRGAEHRGVHGAP